MQYPPYIPFEAYEIANIYTLMSIGATYNEAINMPCDVADGLLSLHKQIKEYEEDEMKKVQNKSKMNRR